VKRDCPKRKRSRGNQKGLNERGSLYRRKGRETENGSGSIEKNKGKEKG